jgi:hypothetical protein
MTFRHIPIALAALAVVSAAGSLRAQVPYSLPAATPKPLSVRFLGAMTVPAFSYADHTADVGWKAEAVVNLRKGSYNSIRLEGEYNTVGSELSGSSGQFNAYGAGIGAGRVLAKGTVEQEGYFVVGGYEYDGLTCPTSSTCRDFSELQFGTKVGTDVVVGRGQGRFLLDLHWLSTWSQPYVSMFAIGGGLRF